MIKKVSEMVTVPYDKFAFWSSPPVTSEPGKCGGKPCIRGMRIRVADILQMLAANVSAQQILEDFPDLEAEDIQATPQFAVQRADHARFVA